MEKGDLSSRGNVVLGFRDKPCLPNEEVESISTEEKHVNMNVNEVLLLTDMLSMCRVTE